MSGGNTGLEVDVVLRKGNMWDSKADLICVTGNATIRKDGCLVMGRGAALECMTRYPGINKEFGDLIARHSHRNATQARMLGENVPYGVLLSRRKHRNPGCGTVATLGLFQVKWHFRGDAEPGLIQVSVEYLTEIANSYEINGKTKRDGLRIAVNMPGVGYGHLHRKVVMPLLKPLPDNVEVWEY